MLLSGDTTTKGGGDGLENFTVSGICSRRRTLSSLLNLLPRRFLFFFFMLFPMNAEPLPHSSVLISIIAVSRLLSIGAPARVIFSTEAQAPIVMFTLSEVEGDTACNVTVSPTVLDLNVVLSAVRSSVGLKIFVGSMYCIKSSIGAVNIHSSKQTGRGGDDNARVSPILGVYRSCLDHKYYMLACNSL